jgi:leucyl aminopeptidase
MLRIRFVGCDAVQPWGASPLGGADAWIAGHATSLGVRGGVAGLYGWKRTARALGSTGAAGECRLAAAAGSPVPGCGFVGLAGLGDTAELVPETAEPLGRRIGAAVARPGISRVFVDVGCGPEAAIALATGLVLRATPPMSLRSKPDAEAEACPTEAVILTRDPALAADGWQRREPAVEATLWARRLVNAPANTLTPAGLEGEARSLGDLGVKVSVIAGTDLAKTGLNLIQAVGQASAVPPRLVVLDWPGANPEAAPLALIGKGITFDTGGISIKPALHMEEMKGDMGGAAAVLGALKVAAVRNSPLRVVGLLAVAENAVGGNATRPGDVIAARDGTTVEIVDTDAEGRLVLADAIAHARLVYTPFLTVDLATLTGAVVRSLGHWRAGLFSNLDAAALRVERAALASQEPVWRLPMPGPDDDRLDSDIADVKNCGWGTVPDAIDAAGFLGRFAGEGAWAHLDIAGTADAPATTDLERQGPKGYGVRLLAELIADLETDPWTPSSD